MINKKILLGKIPQELGQKDAIHVAIVAVRAGCAMTPGTKCTINENKEAVPAGNKGVGIADPFLKNNIKRGQNILLLLNPDEVDNVQHIWEHKKFDFTAPITPIQYNSTLQDAANDFGVTYDQLMEALDYVLKNDSPAPYPGTKTAEELEELNDNFEVWDVWSEWARETLYTFDNMGSECCPEYEYPTGPIFSKE